MKNKIKSAKIQNSTKPPLIYVVFNWEGGSAEHLLGVSGEKVTTEGIDISVNWRDNVFPKHIEFCNKMNKTILLVLPINGPFYYINPFKFISMKIYSQPQTD